MPVLSIIVPVFNVEPYLARCIDSILNQSYGSYELILIDDGSSDSSGKICDFYEKSDTRIKVLHVQNGGQSKARNIGLEVANGKYITFIDSDDFLGDTVTLGESIKLLDEMSECDIVQFPFEGRGWPNHNEGIRIYQYKEISGGKEAIENFGLEGIDGIIYPAPWGKIYRSSLFNNYRFKEGMVFEDSYLLTDLLKNVNKICIIDRGLYCYMYNSDSTMNKTLTVKRAIDALTSHLHSLDVCKDLNIDCQKYTSLVDVVTNDTYCAIMYFKNNVFPKYLLERLQFHIKLASRINVRSRSSRLIILRLLSKYLGFKNMISFQLMRKRIL